MLDPEIIKEVKVSFVGALLALIFAGLVWLLKAAYEKHRLEKLGLAIFERIYAENLTLLNDNFEFIDKWLESVKNNRPYKFHFENFIIEEEKSHHKLSNLKLINQVLSTNYMLRRINADINNIYTSYWEIIYRIDSILDPQIKIDELQRYHETIASTLTEIKKNYLPLQNSLIRSLALIAIVDGIRSHSLFGLLSLLSKDLFIGDEDEKIEKQCVIIKNKISKKLVGS